MTLQTRWKAQQEEWAEAIQQDKASYIAVVNLARAAIEELEKHQFIHHGIDVATFLNPPDAVIADEPDDDHVLEQITQAYAAGPDIDEDGPNTYFGTRFYFSGIRCRHNVAELRGAAKEDYTGLVRQLDTLDRDMKALQISRRPQSTLDRFLISK